MSSCIVLNIVLKPFLKKSGKDYIREKKMAQASKQTFHIGLIMMKYRMCIIKFYPWEKIGLRQNRLLTNLINTGR